LNQALCTNEVALKEADVIAFYLLLLEDDKALFLLITNH